LTFSGKELIKKSKHCFTWSQNGERKPSTDLKLSFFFYFYYTQEPQQPFKITLQLIPFNIQVFYIRHIFSKQHRTEQQKITVTHNNYGKIWGNLAFFAQRGFNPRLKLKPSEFWLR